MWSEAIGASDSVLADVRRSLKRSETVRPAPLEPFVEEAAEEEGEELIAHFTREVEAVGGRVSRVRSFEEACASVADISVSAGACEVVLSGAPLLTELNLRAELAGRGLATFGVTDFGAGERGELIVRLAACGVGVTAVDYAIAETGTIVLSSDEEGELLASLLPIVHIALVRPRQLVGSLATALEKLEVERMRRSEPCRAATFITGPSRTSDVELVLSIGVHGPKELHLIIADFGLQNAD